MALPSSQQVAQKWAQRAGAAAQDYVNGAQQTDKDPTALAIQAIPRMRARVIESIDSGKVAAGLRRSGKQGWLEGITTKGASNYSSGVSAAQGKVEQAFASLLSFEASLLTRVQAMPANTDAERDARALAWIQGMRGYVKPGA